MRLLYAPLYSSPFNIGTDSTFNHVKLFAKTIVENRDCFLYLVVPEETDNPQMVKDAFDHPRIQLIPVPAVKNQHRELVYMPEVLIHRFSEMQGDVYLDALLTDKPTTLGWLQTLLHTWSTNGSGKIQMAVLDRFFVRYNNHAYSPEAYQKSQIFNLALADRCYWSTKNVLDDALEMAKRWVSFSELKKLRDKSIFAYSPLDFARLDPFVKDRDPAGTRVLNYAYALTSGYNMQTNLELFDQIFARGNRDVKVLVTTASPGFGVSQVPEHYLKYMEFHYALPQRDFWEKVSTAHAFVHLPNYCQLSSSVIEQQYLGLVGVFPDKPWAKDMTYPGYPYIARDKKEMAGMLRYVLDEYFSPKVQEVIARQRDFLRERFDGRDNALKLYDDLARTVGHGLVGSRGSLAPLFAEFFADIPVGGEVPYEEWRKRIKEQTRIKYDVAEMPLAMQGVSKNRFRRVMLDIGFVDRYDHNLPHFARVSLYDPSQEPAPKAGVTRIPDDVPLPTAVHGRPVEWHGDSE